MKHRWGLVWTEELAAILRVADEALRDTGYDEISLLSLSTGDYSCVTPLLTELMARYAQDRVAVSLPSLRVGTLTEELIDEIKEALEIIKLDEKTGTQLTELMAATTTIGYDIAAIALGLPHATFQPKTLPNPTEGADEEFQFGPDFYQANARLKIIQKQGDEFSQDSGFRLVFAVWFRRLDNRFEHHHHLVNALAIHINRQLHLRRLGVQPDVGQ